jgi:hypothetical protein
MLRYRRNSLSRDATMYCQKCGCEAPTRHVSFHQNIGLLVMRLYNGTEGNLCKPCIHKTFWTYTAVNLTVGWLGVISLFLAPVFTIMNTVQYLGCLGMESPRPGATPPALSDDFFQRIQGHAEYLYARLDRGEDFNRTCEDVAMRAGVTPAQVALFVQAVAAQRQG